MKKLILNRKSGLTAVEALVYSAILLIVLVFIVQTVISITQTHRQIKLAQSLETSGSLAMERILREVRNSSEIDTAGSVLGSSPGTLRLSGIDDSGAYTLTFDLNGGKVRIARNGGAPGDLSLSEVRVDTLIFRRLSNTNSEAVKIEMYLSGGTGSTTKTLDLYGTAVVRNKE
jgi:hypothetical protein